MAAALPPEQHLQPGTPIGLPALGVQLPELAQQALIRLGPRTRLGLPSLPVIIAAGRNGQRLAQLTNGMLGFHRGDPGVPLGDGSEIIPNVFFNMSRCSVTRASSCRVAASSACRSTGDFPAAGARSDRQTYNRSAVIPSSCPIACADLPLASQCSTAWRLKATLYRRRGFAIAAVCITFIGRFHPFPHSAVSKQPPPPIPSAPRPFYPSISFNKLILPAAPGLRRPPRSAGL